MGSNRAAVGRALRRELSNTIRDVVLLVVDNLKNSTPVDTTNAANNWIATTRRPYTGVDGSREAPSHAAQDAGIQMLYEYDVGRDGNVYIRNNVDYIQYLDAGWSKQAPPGFVARAIMAAFRRAPAARGGAVRKMLLSMARNAYGVRSFAGPR